MNDKIIITKPTGNGVDLLALAKQSPQVFLIALVFWVQGQITNMQEDIRDIKADVRMLYRGADATMDGITAEPGSIHAKTKEESHAQISHDRQPTSVPLAGTGIKEPVNPQRRVEQPALARRD